MEHADRKVKNNGDVLDNKVIYDQNLLFLNRIAAEPVSLNHLKWMKTCEAAQYLRVSTGSIKNMVYRGQLLPRKLGRLNRFLKEDLDRAIQLSPRMKGEC